ncbi:hypothetical protein Leryth_017191 [Lithospermum erythrorhizon]|nr:hypothetical protein Leryth_017191 [Lithospermum erythrorhizon]
MHPIIKDLNNVHTMITSNYELGIGILDFFFIFLNCLLFTKIRSFSSYFRTKTPNIEIYKTKTSD